MVRTRSGVLSLGLFLLVSTAGMSAASHVRKFTHPEPSSTGPLADAGGSLRSERSTEVSIEIRRRAGHRELGVDDCPSDVVIDLWPPNHKLVEIDLAEVLGFPTDSIEITAITQDEPLDDRGDGHTVCDGSGIGTGIAHIRAERSGQLDGRVYEIQYTAFGGDCSGFVTVTVPHDRRGAPAEDDGQLHDSTEGCP